jgi:hypothetical protein
MWSVGYGDIRCERSFPIPPNPSPAYLASITKTTDSKPLELSPRRRGVADGRMIRAHGLPEIDPVSGDGLGEREPN